MNDRIEQFRRANVVAGFDAPDHITVDGAIRRYGANGKPTDDIVIVCEGCEIGASIYKVSSKSVRADFSVGRRRYDLLDRRPQNKRNPNSRPSIRGFRAATLISDAAAIFAHSRLRGSA